MIYILGRIPGDKDAYDRAEERIRRQGKDCINPSRITQIHGKLSLHTRLEIAITLLRACDTVYVLKGWTQSEESRLQRYVAQANGQRLVYEDASDALR